MKSTLLFAITLGLYAIGLPVQAQTAAGTFSVRLLTPETALKAASAALQDCRQRGFQVAVAVVDRGGVAQVMLRDRFAGPHTPETAINKAWTAVSFRTDTLELARATQADQPSSGIRHVPRFVGAGGGVMVQVAGAMVGGIGVSGAPTGEMDEACAKAGIASVRDDLEF